jgi:hypothetical protein
MQHSPSWEANSSSASQEIPHILWNPKVHYCMHSQQPATCPYPDKSVPVTTARHVLRLLMEERPADMEGRCEYTE